MTDATLKNKVKVIPATPTTTSLSNPNVTIIPAYAPIVSAQDKTPGIKRRVAAYARVSTDTDEQLTSYEAQVDYYTKLINTRADWTFVKCYADEGITATNTRKRDGFNEMVADALAGNIDLIVTKSISRFARNTVDSLQTVRALKDKGVEIWFEKENIYTFDSKGELLITIMSSMAQEESRNLSENVAWGHRKRFMDGKIIMPYGAFLGYEKGADGLPQIVPEQAETVRLIYKLFLEGGTYCGIATKLTNLGKLTPAGKKKWCDGTVKSILTNERYKGEALLQKHVISNFLTHKPIKNDGRVPQYYVVNSHPAIVSPELFDAVQREVERRENAKTRQSGTSIFAGKIICGDCLHFFGAKVWHSNDAYKRTIFQCNNKFNRDKKCTTPHLTESDIKAMFVTAANKLLSDKKKIIRQFNEVKTAVFDTSALNAEIARLDIEMAGVAATSRALITQNATTKLDQEDVRKRRAELDNQYAALAAEHAEKSEQRHDILRRKKLVENYIAELKKQPDIVSEFDEQMWFALLEDITVYSESDIRFKFKDGTVITV